MKLGQLTLYRCRPRLRTRVLATSIGIILVFSIALAALINKLYQQSSMAAYSRDLASQIPMVMAQLSKDGLIRANDLTAWIQSLDPSSSDYMSVLCSPDNHTLWASRDVRAFDIDDICTLFPQQAKKPQYLSIAGFNVVAQQLSSDRQPGDSNNRFVCAAQRGYTETTVSRFRDGDLVLYQFAVSFGLCDGNRCLPLEFFSAAPISTRADCDY